MSLRLLEPLRAAQPDVPLLRIPEEGVPPPEVRGEVLLTRTFGAPNCAEVMTRGVRWVHTFGTGVNGYPFETLGAAPLTCSRGASAVPISEWVMAMLLAFEKDLPEAWVNEPPEQWITRDSVGGLSGRRLAILGFGAIGQALARRALAFGMEVCALRRSKAPSPVAGVTLSPSAEALVKDADHIALTVPATPSTLHLVDDALLAQMKAGAHLVNVSRGELIVQDALRRALDSGHLARASLDTVTPEPLPAGHWLYTHPRVRLSPHISWSGPGALDALLAPFIENLRRFRAGEPLLYRVDVAEGY